MSEPPEPPVEPNEELERGVKKVYVIVGGLIVLAVIAGMTFLLKGGGTEKIAPNPASTTTTLVSDVGTGSDVEVMVQARGHGTFAFDGGEAARCGPACDRVALDRLDVEYPNMNAAFVVPSGTVVTLTAYTDPPGTTGEKSAATFVGWGGDCASAGPAKTCSFRVTRDSRITATFTYWYCKKPGEPYTGRSFAKDGTTVCDPTTKVTATGPESPPTAVDDSAVFDPARNKR